MSMDSLERQNVVWLRRPTLFMANAWYLLTAASLWALPQLLAYLTKFIHRTWGVELPLTLYSGGIYCLLMALPVILYAADKPGLSLSLRLRDPRPHVPPLAILSGVTGAFFCDRLGECWARLISLVGGQIARAPAAPPQGWAEMAGALFGFALLPGLCEELLFRGGMLGAWERRGTERALVVSSLAFAALHGSVQGLPVQLLLGFSLGWIVTKTNSLWTGVIFHIVYNSTVLILSYLLGGDVSVNIYAMSRPAMTLFIADTVASCALFGLMLIGLRALCARLVPRVEGERPLDLTPLEPLELVVLMAGIVTVMICYLEDILKICGVL